MGYVALALWVTGAWWLPLGGRLTAVNQSDATLFAWLLTWTPHALGDGQPPLHTTALNAPEGINLMWNNGMALPALLFAPVTAAWGGLATVTVLTALGLAGSATAAFGALRALGAATGPAALGGAVFGFSPAIVAHSLGHPNLVFDVLAPVLVLLAVRLAVEERPRARTAVLLGLLTAVQLLIGEEVLFGTGVVVGLLVLGAGGGAPARRGAARTPLPRPRRGGARGVRRVGRPAARLPAVRAAAPARQPLQRGVLRHRPGQLRRPHRAAADRHRAARARWRFPGGPEEHGGFLGWPLLVVAVVALVFGGRRARVPLAVAAVVGVFAMGEELRVDGRGTGIALPWRLLAGLPGFEHVIPSRLSLFTAGLVGAGLAFAVTALRAPAARAVATILVLAAVLPLTPARLPGVDARAVPAFFTAPAARMCPGGSVLVLPFPAPDTTEPMRWQAASGMAFAMPGGYFIGPAVDGRAYVGGQPTPTGLLLRAVQLDGQVRAPTPLLRSTFAHDVRRWRACAAVLGPAPQADALRAQVTALVGREPESTGGVLLWRGL